MKNVNTPVAREEPLVCEYKGDGRGVLLRTFRVWAWK